MSKSPSRSERGASAVEYGLLISGIAAVIATAVYFFGAVTGDMFTESCEHITSTMQTSVTTSCQ